MQLRESDASDSVGVVAGTAIVYNSRSEKLFGKFYERIRPGAFDGKIGDVALKMNFEHLGHATLGTTRAGTLRIEQRADGIGFEVDLPDTTHGRDARALLQRGDLEACSFEFGQPRWEWREIDGGETEGELVEGVLSALTLTTNPAYSETSAALRSLEAAQLGSEAIVDTRTDRPHLERELRLREAEFDLL